MGMMGSCWATFISRVLMAVAMASYVHYGKYFKHYRGAFRMRGLEKGILKNILNIGVPTGMQWVFEVGAFAFAVVMIGWISKEQQAAHGIALQLAACTYMIASGISAAATVRVGNHLGLNDRVGLRRAGYAAFFAVVGFMGFCAVLFVVLNDELTGMFTNDPVVHEMAAALLLIAALFQLSDGIQVVGLGALRGLKDVKYPTYVTLIAYWVIGLPVSYWLGFPMGYGVYGIWFGLVVGLTVAAVALLWRFNRISGNSRTESERA